MALSERPVLSGHIVEEERLLTLDELSGICCVERQTIVELVEEGVLEAQSAAEWRFAGDCLKRARIALRLQQDLGVNPAGTALVLDLMERIERLQRLLPHAD